MLHRPSVLPLVAALLSSIVACSPPPRWIAVAATDHSVRLFDGRLRPVARLSVPGPPTALESAGDGSSILVGQNAATPAGLVTWLARTGGRVVLERALPAPVQALRLDHEGRRLFVLAGGANGRLTIRDTDSLAEEHSIPVCERPTGLAFLREEDRAYVTCHPGAVVEVDPRLDLAVRTVFISADSGGACGAGRGALSSNGSLLLIPCAYTGRILYLDRVTLQPWDSVTVAVGARVVVAAAGGIAVTLLPDSDRVALVDLRRKRRVATVPTPPDPVDVVLSASGGIAFVVASGRGGSPGALVEIDTRRGTELGRIAVAGEPRVVYLWPGGREPRMHWVGLRPPSQAPQP